MGLIRRRQIWNVTRKLPDLLRLEIHLVLGKHRRTRRRSFGVCKYPTFKEMAERLMGGVELHGIRKSDGETGG